MKHMKSRMQLASALSIPSFAVVFGLVYFFSTLSLPGISVNHPRWVIAVLAFLGSWLIISEVKNYAKRRHQVSPGQLFTPELRTMLIVTAALLGFIIVVPFLGFYLASFVWMVVTGVIIDKERGWKGLWISLSITAIFLLLCYLLFNKLFVIRTPEGLWH
jgi:hypothetical protein